jgi:hypothetical protein
MEPYVEDADAPESGAVQFELVTGVAGGTESGLGSGVEGLPRPNTNPCP